MLFSVIEFKRCIIDYAALLIDEGNLDAGQPNTRLNGKLHFACERTNKHAQLLICITTR